MITSIKTHQQQNHIFHGAGVTILQFTTNENVGQDRQKIPFKGLPDAFKSINISLIDNYTKVLHSNVNISNGFFPIQTVNVPQEFSSQLSECYEENFSNETRWLTKVVASMDDNEHTVNAEGDVAESNCKPLSWTAYHIDAKPQDADLIITLNHKLPVINHVSHDIHFQYHIMSIAKDYTDFLNPAQTTVSCSDCPLYYLKKKIQWACPDKFSNMQYFPLLGGLHQEQCALSIHGDLVKGTGLISILKQAGLSVIGLQTSLADVNHIKKDRYALQVV